jgi:hypothetical protein
MNEPDRRDLAMMTGGIVEAAERELQDLLDLRECRFEPAPSRREIPRDQVGAALAVTPPSGRHARPPAG